jgi:hypothetical protein
VSFDDNAGFWRERQTLTTRDGLVSSQSLLMKPIADGMCKVELVHAGGGEHGHGATAGLAGGSGGGATNGHRHSHHGGRGGRRRSGSGAGSGGAGASGGGGMTSPGGRTHGGGAGTAHDDLELTLVEQSDSVLLLIGTSHASGRPALVETITLQSDMARVRTVQRFDDDGEFQVMYLIREERVIDAVSGSIMRV